jgi:dTDP-4-amino-4,6-dideoxygalactose transaminase
MIPLFKVKTSDKALKMIGQTLWSGMIGEGPRVKEFKEKLEERFKCKNLIPLNSGTSALTLALRLAGVEGGEVITTPFTMIATNVAIMAAGAMPVFADINEDNVNISVESIKSKITSKTKAIMVVHVGGVPCDMVAIRKLGVPIIQDCAHAIDTYYHGQHISYWGDYSMFSFQSIKQLNTGDGGALVIKDDKQYKRAEKLKWFGMSREVPRGMTRLEHQMSADVPEWGYKFHMNDISASIGLANLTELDKVTEIQQSNGAFYMSHLKGVPTIPEHCTPAWWAFYVFVENRDAFMKKMADKGIETTPMWRRNDDYTVFKERMELGWARPHLPNMDKLMDKIVFIPVGWWVNKELRKYIANEVNACR